MIQTCKKVMNWNLSWWGGGDAGGAGEDGGRPISTSMVVGW